MAVDHVKATAITNLDATPATRATAGEGGAAPLMHVMGFATAVASSSVDATYQLVRVPSNCKVKQLIFESEAQGAGAFDIGVYYATDLSNALGVAALLAAAAINQAFFATAVNCAAIVLPTDETNQNALYTIDKRNQPLWKAVGLATDPGGNFDIVATVKTTAVTTGTGKLGASVTYTV